MENTVTISQLADMIIVGGAIGIAFGTIVYLVTNIIIDLIDIARDRRKARKERQAKEPEEAEQT